MRSNKDGSKDIRVKRAVTLGMGIKGNSTHLHGTRDIDKEQNFHHLGAFGLEFRVKCQHTCL